jgi:hypothetical protein
MPQQLHGGLLVRQPQPPAAPSRYGNSQRRRFREQPVMLAGCHYLSWLAVVRTIAEAHEGRVWAENRPRGEPG